MAPTLLVPLDLMLAHWPQFMALLFVGACLALDDTAVAQTWLSQPLPAGLIAGLVVGDPLLGAAVGLPLQLAVLGNLPVGQFFTGELVTPLIGAVGAAAFVGTDPLAEIQIWTLSGWLMVGVVLASIIGDRIVSIQRAQNFRLMTQGLRSLRDGRLRYLERAHLNCLWLTAFRGAAGTAFWIVFFGVIWLPLLAALPAEAREACGIMVSFTPAIAAGSMLELRGTRHGLAWMSMGLAIVMVVVFLSTGDAP